MKQDLESRRKEDNPKSLNVKAKRNAKRSKKCMNERRRLQNNELYKCMLRKDAKKRLMYDRAIISCQLSKK